MTICEDGVRVGNGRMTSRWTEVGTVLPLSGPVFQRPTLPLGWEEAALSRPLAAPAPGWASQRPVRGNVLFLAVSPRH